MCGIAGFYQAGFDFTENPMWRQRLLSMKNSLLHRGPDDNDVLLFPHAGLAHTRLSIIDIEGGHQPMSKRLGDGSVSISYNGEIYNTKELDRKSVV